MGKKAKLPQQCGETIALDTVSVTSSIALTNNETRRMRQLVNDILKSRSSRQYLKMLSYQLIPLVALVVMCSILVAQSAMVHSRTRLLQRVVQENDQVGRFVIAVQVERGLTTTFLSSYRRQSYVYNELISARKNTDEAFALIDSWPDETNRASNEYVKDGASVEYALQNHRHRVDKSGLSNSQPDRLIVNNLNFYTDITRGLIDTNVVESRREGVGVWYQLIAKHSLLLAADFYGIERALGSTFYVQCALNYDNLVWFRAVRTQGEMMVNQAFTYYDKVRLEYNEHLKRAQVHDAFIHVNQMRAEILNNSLVCVTEQPDKIETQSLHWFNNSTRLINVLSEVRTGISDDISRYVENTKQNTFRMIILYALTGTLTILTCVILSICHARKSHTLLSSISYYAKDLSEKKTELASEKKLTLRLVYQLIPKGVAKQLQAGKSVEAMVFEQVTIYFSNIEGFSNFAARSTPMQVINLLNHLYSTCDGCINKHAVYKVDTVGDAYMIVSGIPEPTNNHAFEIACMAVELLEVTETLELPNLPDEIIQFRIGIHTGSCAAGIVGVQMPRYCLFGDSVNIASIMEATGKGFVFDDLMDPSHLLIIKTARRIHISEATMMALEINRRTDQFRVIPRGEIDIKVKGAAMHTYWLERAQRQSESGRERKVIWKTTPL